MLIARRNSRAARPELYHWEPDANSGKPFIALLEKGVGFESSYTDMLEFDHHKPAYLTVNPDEPTDPARLEVEKCRQKMKNDIKVRYSHDRSD